MAFVCVNRKLCALHDAFSVREVGEEPFRGGDSIPPDGTERSLFRDAAPFGSQLDLQRLHGVTSENAHGAFYVFLVATVFNLNAALWSVQKGRSRLNLQVAYISAVAAYTHFEMWLGRDWYVTVRGLSRNDDVETIGVSFSALRVLEWVFTTPVLLLLVQHLHEYAFAELPTKADFRRRPDETAEKSSEKASDEKKSDDGKAGGDPRASRRSISAYAYKPVNKFLLIAADEAMIACGVLMPVFPYGAERFSLLCVSMLCFLFVIKHSVFAIVDIMLHAEIDFADGCRLFAIAALKVIAWSGYPLVYFLTEYGFLTVKQQHEFYLYNDVLTKFSYSLMISAGSLRCLDLVEEHKQKIATQMSQAQRAFFFNVTHELRTPLNSIIGFNTLAMESGELTDFTGAFIKASLTSAEALLGLINQILDFAKFEGAKDANGRYDGASAIELSEDVWTVRQLMEQVTDMTQKATSAFDAEPNDRDAANVDEDADETSSAARREAVTETSETSGRIAKNAKKALERRPDIVVTLATPEHFNTAFVGDFFRLRQCCVNLVDNAVKYSTGVVGRDALVELVVTVTDEKESASETSSETRSSFRANGRNQRGTASSDDDDSADFADFARFTPRSSRVTFEVRDNGVGIPAAKQHALFVPFCQPAEHRAAKEKGTGLGLVITKSIVECMGGEIDFVSVEDVGTRFFFTVEFPRASGVSGAGGAGAAARRWPTPPGGEKDADTDPARGRGSVDAVLDAGLDGGLAGSDGSVSPSASPSGSDGEETTRVSSYASSLPEKVFAANRLLTETEKDDVLPSAARVVVHPSMRAATRRHAVNILKCFRASPGSNYVVCKSLEDVDQKFAQAKRLGAPVVFVEASEDAAASARLVEATASGDARASKARAVSFESTDGDSNENEKRSFERGVVVFGRPRQLMELRKRLGDREDVACVFEPAKPSEVLRATRRLTETLLASRGGFGASDSAALFRKAKRSSASRAGAVDLAGYGFDVTGSKTTRVSVSDVTTSCGSPRESLESPTTPTSLDGMSVLLVEDNLMNQQMAKHSIVKCGVALDIAGDGAEAVALVERKLREQKKYDAILMDMMMPVMDGATATREIRALERDLKIPLRHVIIGLSANVGPSFVTEVRAAGMDGVVSKPFYPKTLRRALLEVRTGEYRGFAEHEPGLGEGPGSSPAGDEPDEPAVGFVEDRGDDEKRVRRVSSSDAAA